MTATPDDARAERVRRLAEQRATPAPTGRRRHAAAAARVLTAGLSSSAFLFGVAALATKSLPAAKPVGSAPTGAPPSSPQTTATVPAQPVTPITVVVVERVHRPVYVDEHGNAVDPATLAAARILPAAQPVPVKSTSPGPAVTPAPATPLSAATPSPTTPTTRSVTPTTRPAAPVTTPTTTATLTTTVTAPPPPPLPPCSGSKCP